MLKLLAVFAALIAIANCQLAGGWAQQESIPENVVELARFATTQLNADLKGTGIYTLMRVRNVQSQVVAGINYKFNMDAVFGDNNGKYSVRNFCILKNNGSRFRFSLN